MRKKEADMEKLTIDVNQIEAFHSAQNETWVHKHGDEVREWARLKEEDDMLHQVTKEQIRARQRFKLDIQTSGSLLKNI
jgi:hypothetical protein